MANKDTHNNSIMWVGHGQLHKDRPKFIPQDRVNTVKILGYLVISHKAHTAKCSYIAAHITNVPNVAGWSDSVNDLTSPSAFTGNDDC